MVEETETLEKMEMWSEIPLEAQKEIEELLSDFERVARRWNLEIDIEIFKTTEQAEA